MPTRAKARLIKVMTPIQGDDAYIVVKSPKWGQLVDLDSGAQKKDWNILGRVLASLVVEWNWVDEDGSPLPLPSNGGLGALSVDEVTALSAAIGEAVKPPLASSPASSST